MAITLDLSQAPSVLFLFGLSAAGKSFVGDLIGLHAGWHVYHADEDLTEEMKLALKEQRPFTNPMRDAYFEQIVKKIQYLQTCHNNVVVTQGTYKQKHRDFLQKQLTDMELVCVHAADEVIHQRLLGRSQGISIESAAALRKDFEDPADHVKVIINQKDRAEIIRQLNEFYSLSTPSG